MKRLHNVKRPDLVPLLSRQTPSIDAKCENWAFQYQKPLNAGDTLPYNVVCAIATDATHNQPDIDYECELTQYQSQLVSTVGCLIFDSQTPNGAMVYFEPDHFQELQALFDGANAIYCHDSSALFGLLKASPVCVDDIKPIETKTYSLPPKNLPIPQLSEKHIEKKTVPQIALAPDPDWKEHKTISPSQPFQNNENDMDAHMTDTFLASKRWLGVGKDKRIMKPCPPYFRDQDMIYWMFKTFGLIQDLDVKSQDNSIMDLIRKNVPKLCTNDLKNETDVSKKLETNGSTSLKPNGLTKLETEVRHLTELFCKLHRGDRIACIKDKKPKFAMVSFSTAGMHQVKHRVK